MKSRYLGLILLLCLSVSALASTLQVNSEVQDEEWLKIAGSGPIEFTPEGFIVDELESQYIEIMYDFADFELSFDVNVKEYGTYGNIYLSLHEQDNFMGHTITFDASSVRVLTRHGYWNDYTTVGSFGYSVRPGTWYNIKVVCAVNDYIIYVNGSKVGQFQDRDGLYPTGSIVIKAANSTMEFKNIQVKADELVPKPLPNVVINTDRFPKPNALISGTFLSLDYSNARWDPYSWEDEFKAMKDLGMDLIVIRPYVSEDQDPLFLVLDEVFAEANRQGFKIMLGTCSNRDYQWTSFSKSVLDQQMVKAKADIDKLYERYSDAPAFFGWYLADEVDEKDFVGTRFETAKAYYGEQVQYLKALTPDKPILMCPSYDANSTSPKWWAKKYSELFEAVKVDIIGPQDSVGAKRATPEQAILFYAGFKEAADKHGVTLWADVEIFDIKTWRPAPIELLKRQLLAVEPHVEKVIIFEFNHYMNPYRSIHTRVLYEDYKAWIEEK